MASPLFFCTFEAAPLRRMNNAFDKMWSKSASLCTYSWLNASTRTRSFLEWILAPKYQIFKKNFFSFFPVNASVSDHYCEPLKTWRSSCDVPEWSKAEPSARCEWDVQNHVLCVRISDPVVRSNEPHSRTQAPIWAFAATEAPILPSYSQRSIR